MAFRRNEMDTRKNSQRLCQHTQNLHRAKLQKVPAMRRGRGHGPTPNQEIIFHWYLLVRENWFSPMEPHWVYQSHLRIDSMPVSSWSSHHKKKRKKKDSVGFVLLLVFFLSYLFFSFVIFLVCFELGWGCCICPCFLFVCFSVFLLFRNREKNEVGWRERWGRYKRSQGREMVAIQAWRSEIRSQALI